MHIKCKQKRLSKIIQTKGLYGFLSFSENTVWSVNDGLSGNLRKPPETSGNLRKPPETSGNLQKPPETSGNLRKPPETSGNLRKPPETSKNLRKPAAEVSGRFPVNRQNHWYFQPSSRFDLILLKDCWNYQ
jgi:hypothetical protein